MVTNVSFHGKQVIIKTTSLNWNTEKILESKLFKKMLGKYIEHLRDLDSDFIKLFPEEEPEKQVELALLLMEKLSKNHKDEVIKSNPELRQFFSDIYLVDQFVEEFYNYWRGFERYLVLTSSPENQENGHIDKRPYNSFNNTIETLNHLVRGVYRDIRENITNEHPVIYRQVPAGCQVGVIAAKKEGVVPEKYSMLKEIPIIRQVLIEPPLIIDPPMNKRKGEFKVVESNPIEGTEFDPNEWLCFPAKVGELTIHFYFHEFYTSVALTISNIFELCTDKDMDKKPDAIYAFGVPEKTLEKFGENNGVFFQDKENNLFVGALPLGEEFAYFGYVKKMILTLYNSIMIFKGSMPVHGAMTRITMKDGSKANVVIFGDTGTGKSESLEAFRILSQDNLKEMVIIFDDMGALKIEDGKINAYGTETGAFVRLDDLEMGYAFGNIDRSIISSPHKINTRAAIPVTTLYEVLHGWPIDYFLYANNYDEVKDDVYLKKFETAEEAMGVFKEGKRMAKGTTNEKGLVGAYYSNIFGPAQFKEEHDRLAEKFFKQLFDEGVYVGQINTQLSISGMEREGPQKAARELFKKISEK